VDCGLAPLKLGASLVFEENGFFFLAIYYHMHYFSFNGHQLSLIRGRLNTLMPECGVNFAMHELKIREAQLSDLPEIMKLISQADMSPDNQLSADDARSLFENITRTGYHKIYIVFSGMTLAGTFALAVVQSLTHNGGTSVVVEDVVVKSDFQGQGIGRKMMACAADTARQLGGQKLMLSSGKARTRAHSFYTHLGYKKDGYRFALKL